MTQLVRASGRFSSTQITFIWIRILPLRIARRAILRKRSRSTQNLSRQRISPAAGLPSPTRAWAAKSEARNILAQLLQAREKRYVSAPVIAAVACRPWRQRRSFPRLERAFAEHSGVLQWIAFLPEFRAASFRRAFPSSFTANRRFAELNFDDYGDNVSETTRSKRADSPEAQNRSKATTRHTEWAHREDYSRFLRPNER